MSEETLNNIIKFYIEENNSLKDTVEHFGISSKRINHALKRMGIFKTQEQKRISSLKSRQKTCLKKYGYDNPSKSPKIKDKIKNVFLEKYGVDNPFKDESIKEKSKKTLLNNYGVEHPMYSSEIKESVKNTNLNKYNVENVFQDKDIKEACKKTLLNNYGVEHPSLSKSIRDKAKSTLFDRYGVDNPGKIDGHRESILRGQNIKTIDGVPISRLAEDLSVSKTTLYKWNNDFDLNLKKLIDMDNNSKNGISSLELYFQENFKIKKWNKSFNNSLKYRPDFKLSEKIYINVDGLYWHSNLNTDNRYHFNMRKEYEDLGLRIFQFRADEVYKKTNILHSIINNSYGKSKKIWARKTSLSKVHLDSALIFLKENHLMGYKSAKHIGLYYNKELVSILSYKIIKSELKIERFCSKAGVSVVGGLSKLLSFLQKNYKISTISSWVDLRYGNGRSLEVIGFKKQRDVLGWKWTNFKETYNRLRCRANMDSRMLSQREYAEELGWVKIYDAGQRLYIKEIS